MTITNAQFEQLMDKLSGIDYQLTALLGVMGILMPYKKSEKKDQDSCTHEFSYYTLGGCICPMCGLITLNDLDIQGG